MTGGYRITPVAAAHCRFEHAPWSFATAEAAAIEENWARRIRATPELFNGPVLLLDNSAIGEADGSPTLTGTFIDVEFKAFLAWRDRGFPPIGIFNCFAMAALETSDGAFVLGEMAPHTAPAGQIYFPSGTPDMSDVVGGAVDLDGSVRRELSEETGIEPPLVSFDDGFVLVGNAVRICCMKRTRVHETAERLVARIHDWLARDAKPELARMHIVRSPDDYRPRMPDFVTAYLDWAIAQR